MPTLPSNLGGAGPTRNQGLLSGRQSGPSQRAVPKRQSGPSQGAVPKIQSGQPQGAVPKIQSGQPQGAVPKIQSGQSHGGGSAVRNRPTRQDVPRPTLDVHQDRTYSSRPQTRVTLQPTVPPSTIDGDNVDELDDIQDQEVEVFTTKTLRSRRLDPESRLR